MKEEKKNCNIIVIEEAKKQNLLNAKIYNYKK